jgi:hypothetical protein
MLHTQGHNLAKLEEAIRESELTVSESGPISSNRDIERTYLDIDRTYERLIAAVHDHLGIHSKDS